MKTAAARKIPVPNEIITLTITKHPLTCPDISAKTTRACNGNVCAAASIRADGRKTQSGRSLTSKESPPPLLFLLLERNGRDSSTLSEGKENVQEMRIGRKWLIRFLSTKSSTRKIPDSKKYLWFYEYDKALEICMRENNHHKNPGLQKILHQEANRWDAPSDLGSLLSRSL